MRKDEVEEVKDTFLKVDGWLTYREGLFLFNSAKKCRSGTVIVEIGSWKGRSTICLARGSKAGNRVKVFAVDPHVDDTFNEFQRNIRDADVSDVIVPIIETSEEASNSWSAPVDFIFIDGSHEYELVKKDFELWYPCIKEDGIMAFHDTLWWTGPRKVVDEKIVSSRTFKDMGFVDSIVYARKVKSNNLVDILKGRITRLIQKIWFRLNPSKFDNTYYCLDQNC